MTVAPLFASPLAGLFLTLGAYKLALTINRRCHSHPLTNPLMLSVLMLMGVLLAFHIDYRQYRDGAQIIHLMLGPVTVALAIPLYQQFARLKRAAKPLMITLFAGSVLGIVSAAGLGVLAGLPKPVVLSLAARSITTPIAMGVAQSIGGVPELAAAFVIVSGIFGAVVLKPLLYRLGFKQDMVFGLATGIAAHGIGTARAMAMSETAGAFAGLAMGLNGLISAVLIPVLTALWR
ncbi:LrgB family protein [Crenobacter sp. SG2305]|uniref:LrgB family protein n=1 Tax=Crenobacter oryzisoli TaxID=3056844 RepID=UPI0025AAD2D4|nr:LrgB family protein [Crenobacter sp. SG2305]MDN0084474.1 LrgB family protein [Crenobacter sp. SG2305]